jgi:flavin-dependent dehydrogenase
MPTRATARGAERTPLAADVDVLVAGASFAGLTLARELEGAGARVLLLDRYEIGERATSACAAPTVWLEHLGLRESIRQTFEDLIVHVPGHSARWRLPFTFSTFDYGALCAQLRAGSPGARFETATVRGLAPDGAVLTDRGEIRAAVVVDAAGWRRVLSRAAAIQPPDARLSRGLEVHPDGRGRELELWLDPRFVRAGYSWSFPAAGEMRVGCGSFEPRDHVKEPTVALAQGLGLDAVRFQGNWIPHQLREAADAGVFFVGDSAGHCLPLTAEGIRPAFYFALALGATLREHLAGRLTLGAALARHRAFSASHRRRYASMLLAQHLSGRLMGSAPMERAVRVVSRRRVSRWVFAHYLDLTPLPGRPRAPRAAARAAATPLAAAASGA